MTKSKLLVCDGTVSSNVEFDAPTQTNSLLYNGGIPRLEKCHPSDATS
jgi:hypothetical protein